VTQIREPDCPRCGHPPGLVVSPVQAFCFNEDCDTLCWNMTKTRTENVANMTVHDLSGLYEERSDSGG
jgi:hypothetical protein